MESKRLLFGLLILVATAAGAGRILSCQLLFEPSIHRDDKDPGDKRRLWPTTRPAAMPTFGSNDRSRWATVRALVDDGTFVVGRRDRTLVIVTSLSSFGQRDPVAALASHQAGFLVRTRSDTGSDSGIIFENGWQSIDKVLHPERLEYYSSKPPLLSVLVAGLYWLLKTLFGWTLVSHPSFVVRVTLLLVNLLPFWIYLRQIAALTERYGTSDWGKLFTLTAAGFGTLVSPFLITLNNHTVATYSVLFALVCLVRIWDHKQQHTSPPWHYFVAAGLFAGFAVANKLPALAFAAAVGFLLFLWFPGRTLIAFMPALLVPMAAMVLLNYAALGIWRPVYSELKGSWYQYEGSYWREPIPGQVRDGIDWARTKESRLAYAFHVLVGHHGLFSLTPLWLLSLVTMIGGTWRWLQGRRAESGLPWFVAPMTLALTIIVLGFYLVKSDNYGGWTLGLRWLMWLTPLWLTCLIPIADALGKTRWGRALALICLALAVLAAHYSPWNPWRHPWLYDLAMELGWPGY